MMFYGISNDEDGYGVGTLVQGIKWKTENHSNYIEIPINPERPELGVLDIQVFGVYVVDELGMLKDVTDG